MNEEPLAEGQRMPMIEQVKYKIRPLLAENKEKGWVQPVVCEYGPVEGLRELFRNPNAKMKRFGVKKSIFCLNSLFDGPNARSNSSSYSSEEDEFEDEFEEEKKEEEKKGEPQLILSYREKKKLRKSKGLLKNIKSSEPESG